MGPTPFENMIFYLWTDSNEICTAYVKLNSKHISFMENFSIFDLVFEKIAIFMFLRVFKNFFKKISKKPSMLEEKQGQF